MRKLVLFLILIVFLTFSCKEKAPTAPEEKRPEALAEATIGISGGELKTDEFSLIVPEGALAETENIKLFLNEDEVPFSANKISNSFKIEGIPRDFNKDLTIKIKYTKAPEGECFIALGSMEFIQEREENQIIYDLIEAKDSAEYLICIVEPFSIQNQFISKRNNDIPPLYLELYFHIAEAYNRIKTYKSRTTEIKYPASLDYSKIQTFGAYFDEAFNYFIDLKLLQESARNLDFSHKIKIILLDNNSLDFFMPIKGKSAIYSGYTFANLLSKYKINIGITKFELFPDDKLRMIAGEGVYRFLRTIYIGAESDWFDWATIAWIRHKFLQNTVFLESEYINIDYLLMQSLQGMEGGQELFISGEVTVNGRVYSSRPVLHGIGMMPFIKFVMDNYNSDGNLLINIFEEIIKNDKNIPTDFLIKKISTPENIWWPHFVKEYLLGNILKNSADDFLNKIPSSDEIYFTQETDTLKYFNKTYTDLSAKLCRIITSQEVKEKETLFFKIDPSGTNLDYVKVLVFGVLEGKFVLLNEGTEFSVSDLQQYSTLVACVVNSGNEPPYTSTSNINLEVRTNKNKNQYPYLTIVLRNIGVLSESYSVYYEKYDTLAYNHTFYSQPYEMTKEGDIFIGIKDQKYDWGVNGITHEIGNIEVIMDENSKNITSFSINHKLISNDDLDTSVFKAEGHSIPFYWQSETSLQQYLETNIYSHLTKFEYRSSRGVSTHETKWRVIKIVPNDIAEIWFEWTSEL